MKNYLPYIFKKHSTRTVSIMILLFTVLQIAILSFFGYTPYPDSEGYLYLARESMHWYEPYPVRGLLYDYPFLWNIGTVNLALFSLKVFGSVVPLLFGYAVLKGATAILFYLVTKKLFSSHIASIALVLYVLYPANYGESTSLLGELPFVFLIMLALYSALCRRWLLVAGLIMAVANWVRPLSFIFLLSLMGYLFLTKKGEPAMKRWRTMLMPLGGYLLMILFIGTLTMNRTGLFLYKAKSGWMALADYSTDHSPASMAIRDREDWNVQQKDSAWRALFFDWMKEHPGEYVAQMPKKLALTYISDNTNMCAFMLYKHNPDHMYQRISMPVLAKNFPQWTTIQWLTVLNLLIYYTLMVLAILGIVRVMRQYRTGAIALTSTFIPLGTILLGTILLLFFGHGEARFHQPLMPFFLMLAAFYLNRRICKG